MIKLVLSDLDDTLIRVGLPHATSRALAGIHAMLDAGLRFGPVSGRIPSDLGWMFANDAACYATGALVNGQMVYVDGRLVHVETLDGSELNRLAALLADVDDACLAVYDIDDERGDDAGYFVSPNSGHAVACQRMFPHFRRSVRQLEETTYIKASVWCGGSRTHVAEVRDMLREEFPGMDFVFPGPTAPIVDILPHGWGKGEAVRCLARELGIGLDEIAIFGDSENDLSMIEVVPNSVAVSNATPEIERAARWHIGSAEDDAVADALFQIAEAAATQSMPVFMGR